MFFLYQFVYIVFFVSLMIIGLIVFLSDVCNFYKKYFKNEKTYVKAMLTITAFWVGISSFVFFYIANHDKNTAVFLVFFYSIALWLFLYSGSIHILKKQKISESLIPFKVKVLKSIIPALSKFTVIVSIIWFIDPNKGLFSNFIFLSNLTISLINVYWPLIDIYKYTKEEFQKEQDRRKEKMKYDYYNYD